MENLKFHESSAQQILTQTAAETLSLPNRFDRSTAPSKTGRGE